MVPSRFQAEHVPTFDVRPDGSLLGMTLGARQMFAMADDAPVDGSLFSYLHQQNLHQVARDLAEMVRIGKRRVAWLVRIRTGRTWRWVKATATNLLDTSDRAIRVEFSLVTA